MNRILGSPISMGSMTSLIFICLCSSTIPPGEKQTLASHAIGELVKVTVTKVTNQGVLCSLPDGTKALATDDHVRGEANCLHTCTSYSTMLKTLTNLKARF